MKGFRKYSFGLMVFAWFVTSLGLPVYFHYCAGELETVSYYVETDGCCDGEESADDCCSNEELCLINLADVAPQKKQSLQAPEFSADLLVQRTQTTPFTFVSISLNRQPDKPDRLLLSHIISSTVIRI